MMTLSMFEALLSQDCLKLVGKQLLCPITMLSRRAQRLVGPSAPPRRLMVNRAGRRSPACRTQAVLLRYIAGRFAHARPDCMPKRWTSGMEKGDIAYRFTVAPTRIFA
jgi:hypothetical protein